MKIKVVIFAFFSLFAVVSLSSVAQGVDLEIVTTADGDVSSPQTEFDRGGNKNIVLVIKLKDAEQDSVAGTAFTLNYPANVVTPPTLGDNGLPENSEEISSFFWYQMLQIDKTFRVGEGESGELLFSGANIDSESGKGGALPHSSEEEIFTILFQVKNDAPEGTHTFSVEASTLTNEKAGWDNEKVDILIGAVNKTDSQGNSNPDFNNLDCEADPDNCAFPVLLSAANFSGVSTTISIPPPPSAPQIDVPQNYSDGLNLVPFTPVNSEISMASDWDSKITSENQGVFVAQIQGWDPENQRFLTPYIHLESGLQLNDFSPIPGVSYFIETNGGGSITLSGTDFSSLQLFDGLNLMAVPYGRSDELINASDLDQDIATRTGLTVRQIQPWDPNNQRFGTPYIRLESGLQLNDFSLEPGSQGLFVEVVGSAVYNPY